MNPIRLVVAFPFLLCSCDDRTSRSQRTEESTTATDRGRSATTIVTKSADEALKIARINMTSEPEVIYSNYEGGWLDDSMELVIRFAPGQLDDFWSGSPWDEGRARASSGDGSTGQAPRITQQGGPEWIKWLSSSKGMTAEASLPNGEAARVYICEDVEEGFIHAFIFWHET